MKLSQEQQRVKELLSDTITRLCLSGFTFKTEFTIEALVGITLDNTNVILFNINETVSRASSMTGQATICENPPTSGIDPTTDNGTSVCAKSTHCSISNASPRASALISPVICTRASMSKINSKSSATVPPIQVSTSLPLTTPRLKNSTSNAVGNASTKTYVKILPKEVNTQEAAQTIPTCSVPSIVPAPKKRGRRPKSFYTDREIKTTAESQRTIENSFRNLPNASESLDESKTPDGSNDDDDDSPTLNDSSPKQSRLHGIDATGELFVVKEEPVDNDDYDSSMDESSMQPAFALTGDSTDRSYYAYNEVQTPDAEGDNEMDEYVRDICVNEHRQSSQSDVDESMQDDQKELSTTPDPQLSTETTKASSGVGTGAEISKRSLAQMRRRQGLPYINGKGELIGGKEMKPQNCSRCKLRCAEKLSEADRREIFHHFWQMGSQQVAFVQSYVREVPVQFLTLGHQSRRSRTLQYFLPSGHEKVKVCRDMFLNTLNLSVNTLYTKLAKV